MSSVRKWKVSGSSWWVFSAILLGSCGSLSPTPAANRTPVIGVGYSLQVLPDLSRLTVHACVDGPAPREMRISTPGAARVDSIRWESGASTAALQLSGRTVTLPAGATPGCLVYQVDLMVSGTGFSHSLRTDSVLIGNASHWLFRVPNLAADAPLTLTFNLPEGVGAATPWSPVGDGSASGDSYRLTPSVFTMLSHVVIGEFESTEFEASGVPVQLVSVVEPLSMTPDEQQQWVRISVSAATAAAEPFPCPKLLVVAVPTHRGNEPIVFGQAGRGGGGSVMLIVQPDASLDELTTEWVFVHELSHMLIPFVRRSDAWLSEGLATYYQEVLRARSGAHSPLQAWRNLDNGFSRGGDAGTGRSLRDESRDMYETRAFRRVYWGGTAVALSWEVALRRRALAGEAEHESIDEVLGAFRNCCFEPQRSWLAEEAISRFDEITGAPVLRDSSGPILESADAPNLDGLYAYLGLVRNSEGLLEFDDEAEGAAIRDAIMSGD